MREIKFRAWHKDKMLSDVGVHDGMAIDDADRTYDTPNLEVVRLRPAVLMQYTGLHDKDGKEIYEGDIIQKGNGVWGVVIWKAPFFEITVSADQSSLYTKEWIQDSEVIGNIYENPELLEAK